MTRPKHVGEPLVQRHRPTLSVNDPTCVGAYQLGASPNRPSSLFSRERVRSRTWSRRSMLLRLRYLQKFVRRKHRGYFATGNGTEHGAGPGVLVAGRRRDFGNGPPPHPEDCHPAEAPARVGETEPVEPGENDCCGNGCLECVWTVYWDELAKHQGRAGLRDRTAFELLEARLRREQALRDEQAAASASDVPKTER